MNLLPRASPQVGRILQFTLIQITLPAQHLQAEQWSESSILSGKNFTACKSEAPVCYEHLLSGAKHLDL